MHGVDLESPRHDPRLQSGPSPGFHVLECRIARAKLDVVKILHVKIFIFISPGFMQNTGKFAPFENFPL